MSFKSGNNLFYWQDVKCRLTWRHTPQYTPLWSREKLELGGGYQEEAESHEHKNVPVGRFKTLFGP